MRHLRALSILFVLSCSFALAQQSSSRLNAVIAQAQKDSPVGEDLRVLTDEIGGRVPNTPAMAKAVQWGMAAFKQAGADSVHVENFTIPSSWAEGPTSMKITAPNEFKVRVVSMGWTPAFTQPGPVRVVDVGAGKAADFQKAGDVAGAVVLVHSNILKSWADLFDEYERAPETIDLAIKGKAVAMAFISSREHDILYRHVNISPGQITKIPMVLVAREDGERIARLLAAGKKVMTSLSVPNKVGPAFQAQNVVAEIKGSEKPEEFVILGAHLDSWELGTGALDNGVNCALVIDALKAIKASGVKPKRSIRFILYSGEEQGLIGSREYEKQHRGEINNAVAQVIFDTGIGAVTGYTINGRPELVSSTTRLLSPLQSFGVKEHTTEPFLGTDHVHYMLQGVPTFVANQDEANYLVNYHASSDTYDKVDLNQLRKHVVIAAGTIFALADMPERIGKRMSAEEVDKMVQSTELARRLKLFDEYVEYEEIAAWRRKNGN
jgi:hypothetical protein